MFHPLRARPPRLLCYTGAVLLLLAVSTAPAGVDAQTLYGSIVGNVTDNTGAALPGATVTVTHAQTNTVREAVTDGTGAYRFPTLQPGNYTIEIKMEGFRAGTRSDITVSLNSVTRIDMALQIGALTETVTVEATSPVLQTDRAEVRSELTSRELTNLPVPIGRNYQQLFRTLPGFTPPADAHSVPSNPSRALTFNVNGASQSINNTRIDGVSTTNIWLPHVVAYVPALESLETVNVVTNSFDAEQGLAGGAAINVQIKSGTNQLRGSAFEYHTNEHMRSLPYFAPPGTPKGEWRYNQFGGTVGGPIVRNRLFYFVSYEATRDRQNVSNTYSVPTEALRRGDFTASVNPIFDPMTGTPDGFGRTPFPGNIIPADRFDPIALRMIPLLPLPNLPGEQNNYFVQAPFIFNRWTVDSKVNFQATPALNFFGRYSILDFFQDNATAFGEQLQGPPIGGGNPGIGTGKTHNLSGGLTYTISSNMVVDANVGWVRMNTGVAQTDVNENKGLDWLGIPGTNGPRFFEGGMPRFGVGGFTAWGVTENYMPYYRSDDQIQNVVNLNWIKGRHNLRFGTDIYYQAMNHTQPEITGGTSYGARGGFDFGAGPTILRGGAGGNFFNNWATFMLGLPTQLGRLNQVLDPYTTRNWQYSVYARDQWQATPQLTISYGLRWEYFPIPTRVDRGLERYNWRTNMMEIGGVGNVPTDLGVKVSKSGFAPRLGVAYRATPTTVFRAGFGLTNDPYALARPLRTNHPILLNLVEQSAHSWAWVRSLGEGISPIPSPDLGNGIVPVPGNVTTFTLPDEFERGYIQSWNTAAQRELGWGFVGEAAYVATRQVNQLGFRELNWSPIGGGLAGRQLNQQFGRTAQTRLIAPIGNTSYHSLQSKLERRFSQGLQIGVNYTWSRAMGIAGAPNSDNAPQIQIPEFYHLNYTRSNIDRPHSFHVTNLTELPFGAGQRWLTSGIGSKLAGGWMVNNIVSFFSGTPFNVTASNASLNAPESNTQRADLIGPVRILGGHGPGNSYFDPNSFAPVTEARYGTAPYNLMHGPGFWRWDVGLFREFRFLGERSLQFRFEAFNALDNPRFNNPGGNVSNLQRAPDGSILNLNGFTEITGTAGGSQRHMRLGLRLGF